MYASLDRIDLISTGEDGRPWYIQTDHRSAEEIAQTAELSTIFALLRILNAQRMAESRDEQARISYVLSSPPPAFFIPVIAAAGAQAQIGLGEPEAPPAEVPALDELLQEAFAALAERTAADHRVPLSMDGLAALELELTAEPLDAEEDTIGYWTTVVALGALAGEVMRTANGGHWAAGGRGTLPIILSTRFNGEDATVNPLGKAIKLLANGEEDSLVPLARLIISQP
jgi:hypothetical protein